MKEQNEQRIVNGFNVDAVTAAPLQLTQTARLNATVDEVFAIVSDHAGLHKWTPFISKVQLNCDDAATPGGEGTLRYCKTPAGLTLHEKIVAWNPPHMYGYRIRNFQTLLPSHFGLVTVEPDGDGKALLTWRTYFESKMVGGMMARAMLNVVLPNLIGNLVKHFDGEMLSA
jgi:carbon monoxide dehydrogenase subunit G